MAGIDEPAPMDPTGAVYLNGATIMTTPSDRSIEIARVAGYQGVELRAERLLEAPDEVRAVAGVAHHGEVWSLNGIQIQLDANGGLDQNRLEAELGPRLAICRAVGAAHLLVVPPRTGALTALQALDGVRAGLAIAREQAEEIGVEVAFEFLGFADSPISTPALAGDVVATLPGARLVLDSCHWHASGAGPLDGFPVERLAMVHLNDAPAKPPRSIEDGDRVLPGRGVIDLGRLIGELRSRGYRGPWSLETFNPGYWTADPLAVAREGKTAIDALID